MKTSAVFIIASQEPSFADDAVRYFSGLLIVAVIIGVFMLLSAAVKGTLWPNYRAQIEKWCRSHNLQPLSVERRYLRTGPFFFSFGSTAVFYVIARDPSENERRLWFRYGNWTFGILFSDMAVEEAD